MNELNRGWKLFRLLMVLQMIIIAFDLTIAIVALFEHRGLTLPNVLKMLSYTVVFCFLYMGIVILNNHYPDTPLSRRQKTWFNYLFILNFMAITLLFAVCLSVWRATVPILLAKDSSVYQLNYVNIALLLFLATYPFLFHLFFLGGMMRLRKLIYQNTVEKWEKQFEK